LPPALRDGTSAVMPGKIVQATPEAISEAARLLREGNLVAFPTETVYGLGGDATSETAVARIFAIKARPHFNPVIVHVPGIAEAEPLAELDERAREAARRFWPGALTLVLRRRADAGLSLLASAGLDTLALRAPAHPVAQQLLRATGKQIAAPSANRSGRVSPTTAAHVADELGDDVALILDGGGCIVGLESTVLDMTVTTPALLRPGGVSVEALTEVLGPIAAGESNSDTPRSPGQLVSHYAPRLALRMDAAAPRAGEALLAFGPCQPPSLTEMLNLSPRGNLTEAAANLFAMMRRLDRPEFTGIAVMPIPDTGLGRAINDRLRRAAAPRS